MPYYSRDPKRDPNFDNHPLEFRIKQMHLASGFCDVLCSHVDLRVPTGLLLAFCAVPTPILAMLEDATVWMRKYLRWRILGCRTLRQFRGGRFTVVGLLGRCGFRVCFALWLVIVEGLLEGYLVSRISKNRATSIDDCLQTLRTKSPDPSSTQSTLVESDLYHLVLCCRQPAVVQGLGQGVRALRGVQ